MITIEKQKPEETHITKLVIKTPKEALIMPELAPKKLKQAEQQITPITSTNNNTLFKIY